MISESNPNQNKGVITNNYLKNPTTKGSLSTIQFKINGIKKLNSTENSSQSKHFNKRDSNVLTSSFSKKKNFFPYYSSLSKHQLKERYKHIEILIVIFDIAAFIIDLIIICILYWNHFRFNKNGYKLFKSDNTIRLTCLLVSGVIIAIKVVRNLFLIKRKKVIEYILKLRTKIPKKKINIISLTAEIVTHLIQPYPYVDHCFKFSLLGVKIIYSADIILLCLSLFRMYTFIHLLNSCSMFFSLRSFRIYDFLHVKSYTGFLYRAELKYNSFGTIALIFTFILVITSFVFKIFEFYQVKPSQSDFGNYSNSFWYLLVTMLGSKFLIF